MRSSTRCPLHYGYKWTGFSWVTFTNSNGRLRIGWDTPGALFGGMTLDKGGEDCVGEGKLSKILGDFFFLFVLPKPIYVHPGQPNWKISHSSVPSKRTRTLKNASRLHLLHHRFKRNRRGILVVDNNRLFPVVSTFRQTPVQSQRTYRIILHTALGNQVNDTCRIRKRGHVLPDLVDGEDEILDQVARELCLCLVSNDDDRRSRVGICLGPNKGPAEEFGER